MNPAKGTPSCIDCIPGLTYVPVMYKVYFPNIPSSENKSKHVYNSVIAWMKVKLRHLVNNYAHINFIRLC